MTEPLPETLQRPAAASLDQRFLEIEGINKAFGSEQVLRGIELHIRRGEFFTLLGPSGCGKTTLLRILSGFEQPDSGRVILAGSDLTRTSPERRPFNMVFQSYALFPHMSVTENVGYGLRARGMRVEEIRDRVDTLLGLVGLGDAGSRSVVQLSGGQQQRVALARALVNEPKVLLLDEPLGALDFKLRKQLQDELRSIQRRLGTAFVYVTHDQEEALTLSDRIGLVSEGRLLQVGAPRNVYERPMTRFAAQFIGDANLVSCELLELRGDIATLRLGSGPDASLHYSGTEVLQRGARMLAVLRPEHLAFTSLADAQFQGKVNQTVFMGTHSRHEILLDDGTILRVMTPPAEAVETGSVGLQIRQGHGVVVEDDLSN